MKKIIVWSVCAIVGIAMVASVAIPNLMRSRIAANEAMRVTAEPMAGPVTAVVQSTRESVLKTFKDGVLSSVQADRRAQAQSQAAHIALASSVVYAQDQMVVRSAKLDLLARDVRSGVEQVRLTTERLGGYIEKADLADAGNGMVSAEMIVRVPKAHLDQALAAYKSAAIRVENESLNAEDVTREWVDTDARLRNFKAEEDQYLTILKRASKVQDTLDVADKLSGVRGEIERLQAELNYMSHQVAMSAVVIHVKPQPTVVIAGWHPGENAREAWKSVVAGLTGFVDFIVTVVITVPLVLVWAAFIGAIVWVGWRVVVAVRKRYPATTTAG